MSTKKQLYRFKEMNDNEGETWRFYLYMTDAEYAHLVKLINGDDFMYQVMPYDETPATIKALVKDAETDYDGYAPPHQLAALKPWFMTCEDSDKLYKFQFLDTFSISQFAIWKQTK